MKISIPKKRLREIIKEELEAAAFKEAVLGRMKQNKPMVGSASTPDPLRMEKFNRRFEGLTSLEEKQRNVL